MKIQTLRYMVCVLLLALGVNPPDAKANLYEITSHGQIIPDNLFGTLSGQVGRNFVYNATYDLNVANAVYTRVNWQGYTVYGLDDGGNTYGNNACIYDGNDLAGGDCFASSTVEFEFNDNIAEDWTSDPGLAFLNLNVPDGTPYDIIVLGFYEPATNVEFYMSLIFSADLFDGYAPADLPTAINLDNLIVGAGEFAERDASDEIIGFAQFLVQSNENRVVPEPATMSLLALGGLSLLRKRRKH